MTEGEIDDTGTLTRHGMVLGTARYMSPEQARGEAISPASDMYSFGLLLHELFSEKPPYEEDLDPRVLLVRAANAKMKRWCAASPQGLPGSSPGSRQRHRLTVPPPWTFSRAAPPSAATPRGAVVVGSCGWR